MDSREMSFDPALDIARIWGTWEAVAVRDLCPVWDLRNEDAALAEKLFERQPGVKAICQAMGTQLPYLKSRRPVKVGPFVRPMGHGRSYYIDVEVLTGSHRPSGTGHLAIKGSEVASDDYGAWMKTLRRARQYWGFNVGNEFSSFRSSIDTNLNTLERWPLVERKVPGAVTFSEAMGEASIALEFQNSYAQRYGDFARIPLPLFVYRWPESISQSVWSQLQPLLTKRAAEVVEHTIARGLGVYVYYYPALPIRLMSLEGNQPRQTVKRDAGSEGGNRTEQISQVVNARDLIERWTDLFVRMLALGYLPKDPGSFLTADCMQPWNAVLDGGFVDIDSIVRMELLDETDVDDGVRRSLRGLVLNVAYLMLGSVAFSMDFRDRFPELTWIVVNDVRRRLAHEASHGGIPASLRPLVEATEVHEYLDRLFRQVRS